MNLDPDSIRRLEGHAEVLQALLSGRTRSPVVRHMLLFDAARRAQNRRQEAGVVLEVDSDDKVAQLVEELVKSTCVARPPYADLITTVAQLTFEKKGLIEMVLLALVSLPGLSTVVSRIGGSQGQGEKAVAAAILALGMQDVYDSLSDPGVCLLTTAVRVYAQLTLISLLDRECADSGAPIGQQYASACPGGTGILEQHVHRRGGLAPTPPEDAARHPLPQGYCSVSPGSGGGCCEPRGGRPAAGVPPSNAC
jgi:hypothetical protein